MGRWRNDEIKDDSIGDAVVWARKEMLKKI
jgi:hypothetical protein